MTPSGRVVSADGTRIAVFTAGDTNAPTVVAVHGYPDNHTVWNGVAAHLAERFHVATYDVRGAGDSDKPAERAAYRMDRLVEDLTAVIDSVSPDRSVHLLAHDWGSIQTWSSVTDPALQHRIASYTSISGPSLDHVGMWLRKPRGHLRAALLQPLHSYYIALMHIPGLVESAWRSGIVDRALAARERADRTGGSDGTAITAPIRSDADKLNGINLYRANMLPRLMHPSPGRTDLPVQVIAPLKDPYVPVELQIGAPAPYASDLRTRTIVGTHWVVTHRPDVIAAMTAELIDEVEAGTDTVPIVRRSSNA